jgi:hypothetical protein
MFAALNQAVIVGLLALVGIFITSMLAPMVQGWVKGKVEADAIKDAAERDAAERLHVKIEHEQEAADRRAEKQQDWDRQDLVADRAAKAAKDLLESQVLLAKQQADAAALLVINTQSVTAQLKVIDAGQQINHLLLNSEKTAGMKRELVAEQRTVALLTELAALHRSMGHEPTPETLAAIETSRATIRNLAAELDERAEQQKLADAHIAKQGDARLPAV